jgi:hypothetical protein
LRGVVITVDLEGWPVLTEVLATTSSRVFFVTERLERAAEQEFGAALRHRKFAIERSSRSVPGIVVARVIQDGPMPMGPMLYVTRNQQTVTTVLCRCMPAQLKSIEGPRNYELVMIEWPRDLGLEGMALNDCLRLPGTWPRLFDELDSLEPGGRRTGPTP